MALTKNEEEEIIEENLWLVDFVAKKYKHLTDYNDLVSAGHYGLVRGLRKYDPSRGKASTYLVHWVRASIMECLYENRNVHVPWNKINDYINDRKSEGNVYSESLTPKWEISLDHSSKSQENSDGDDMGSDNIEFQSSLSSESTNKMKQSDTAEHISFAIETSNLTEIERYAVVHRFGLRGEEGKTLYDIANLRNYTAMGIQKAEKRGLKKLGKNKLMQEALE
jgi:RNA polymerase primary sigma factor|tara:strand:+ start:458 stop:1126 length:669 start_codon:yes stop_codon:yes gene_type:complete